MTVNQAPSTIPIDMKQKKPYKLLIGSLYPDYTCPLEVTQKVVDQEWPKWTSCMLAKDTVQEVAKNVLVSFDRAGNGLKPSIIRPASVGMALFFTRSLADPEQWFVSVVGLGYVSLHVENIIDGQEFSTVFSIPDEQFLNGWTAPRTLDTLLKRFAGKTDAADWWDLGVVKEQLDREFNVKDLPTLHPNLMSPNTDLVVSL